MPTKPEHVPLLGPGLHTMLLEDVKALCVDGFSASTTRVPIFAGLADFIAELIANGVAGDLWIDGSFVTKKLDPKDCDVVLAGDGNQIAGTSNTTIKDYLKARFRKENRPAVKAQFKCDAYYFPVYKAVHIHYRTTTSQDVYWRKQFGYDRNSHPKGIAVVALPVPT